MAENDTPGTGIALGVIFVGAAALCILAAGLLLAPLLILGESGLGSGGAYTGPIPHGTTTQNVLYWRSVACAEAAKYKPWNQTTPQFVNAVDAIMTQESGGNPNAYSYAGAEGLMQVLPDKLTEIGWYGSPFDPKENIAAGENYLRYLFETYYQRGGLAAVAAGYNGGDGGALAYLQCGMPCVAGYSGQTYDYVLAVQANYKAYSALPQGACGAEAPSKKSGSGKGTLAP